MTAPILACIGLVLAFAGAGAVAVLLDVHRVRPMLVFVLGVVATAIVLLLGGCAHAPVELIVRRCDSLGDVSMAGRELGPLGYRIASVTPLGNGWAYVVIFERRGGVVHP